MSFDRRLRFIADRLPATKPPAHYPHLYRLTNAELREFEALSAKAVRPGGLDTLSRDEIDRGAFLASKATGEPEQRQRPAS